jgi:hypothetical protein
MGKLNLLHHKSWHVYSEKNVSRVRRDEIEEERRLEEEARKKRTIVCNTSRDG